MASAQYVDRLRGQVFERKHAGADGIADIVVDISNGVGNLAHFTFEGMWLPSPFSQYIYPYLGVVQDTISYLPAEIQASTFILQEVNNSQALLVMPESLAVNFIQYIFTHVSERSMTQVVTQRDQGPFGIPQLIHMGFKNPV